MCKLYFIIHPKFEMLKYFKLKSWIPCSSWQRLNKIMLYFVYFSTLVLDSKRILEHAFISLESWTYH